jgi:hypothetical protein
MDLSRGLGDVYKRQAIGYAITATLCIAAFWLLLIVTP